MKGRTVADEGKNMLDTLGLAPFPEASGNASRQPQPLLNAAQQEHAASDDSCPLSNPTLNFLRQADGRSNGSAISSFMTGVALLTRLMNRSRNLNHESNGGFALHPSLNFFFAVNKTG